MSFFSSIYLNFIIFFEITLDYDILLVKSSLSGKENANVRQIIIAENAGFCFGVKRAVDMTSEYNTDNESKVYTLGPLIHNRDLVEKLEQEGIRRIDIGEIPNLKEGDTVVIRSHGVVPDIIDQISRTGAKVLNATCPYVTSIQMKARKYHGEGYQIIIVGDKNHPE